MPEPFIWYMRKKPTVHRIFFGSVLPAAACLGMAARAHAAPLLTELEGTRQVCSLGPDAALARARQLQGEAEVTAAGVLPNPSLSVQHQRALSGPEERETIIGLSVPLGVSGRRGLLRDAAAARREQAFAEAGATLFESALDFREAYLAAVIERGRAEILDEQQTALDASSSRIEALTKSGEAAAYDLLRQRVQARLHRASVESARARALALRARIAAWTDSEVELPSIDLEALARDSTPAAPAHTESPPARLQSVRAASRASAIEARAAHRRWVPDPEVFAGYRVVAGDTALARGLSLSLTIPLTFFDHGQGEAAQAEAEARLLEASAEGLSRQQRAEAHAARARLQQLSSGITDLGQAREDARELLTQAQQLYAAGEASITEMLEAFRAAEDAQLAELDRASEIALARLSVMRATGTMFDASLDRACIRPEQRKP
jgi:outer membrane protein, heavy metal efflux system